MNKPLILVSGLRANEAEQVLPWLMKCERPMYFEATSRLRGHFELEKFTVRGGDKSISGLDFDSVIRIGNVPTLRYWRDLEKNDLPVHNFSNIEFSGLPRVQQVQPLRELASLTTDFEPWSETERRADRELAERREKLLREFPLSEPAWVNWLSSKISKQARVLLGNSLPIREWDFAASSEATRDIYANRGTNGIDGLVSTFAGLAREDGENWAVIGDLSALYDLSGPWALRARPVRDLNIVIINNGGGQIFNRMFRNPLFINEHSLRFDGWAGMWDMDYIQLNEPRELGTALGPRVIEILPLATQTEAFWNAWENA